MQRIVENPRTAALWVIFFWGNVIITTLRNAFDLYCVCARTQSAEKMSKERRENKVSALACVGERARRFDFIDL